MVQCAKQAPNAWGVYDMPGNAAEWVSDYYDPTYYQHSPTDDPPGSPTGTHRVVRGYSNSSLFFDKDKLDPYHARRMGKPTVQDNSVGFRIVRDKLEHRRRPAPRAGGSHCCDRSTSTWRKRSSSAVVKS